MKEDELLACSILAFVSPPVLKRLGPILMCTEIESILVEK